MMSGAGRLVTLQSHSGSRGWTGCWAELSAWSDSYPPVGSSSWRIYNLPKRQPQLGIKCSDMMAYMGTFHVCGSLNEKCPYRLRYLKVWFLMDCLGRIRRCDLVRRGVLGGMGFEAQSLCLWISCKVLATVPGHACLLLPCFPPWWKWTYPLKPQGSPQLIVSFYKLSWSWYLFTAVE